MVSNKKQLARVKLIELSAPPLCPQKDLYHRINFSYQASIFFSQLDLKVPVGTETGRKGKRRAIDEENGENAEPRLSGLAWGGMGSTKKMAAHNQLKLDPSLKRTICKTCSTILVPGLTSRVRNRPDRNHFNVTHYTCLACSAVLTIPCPPMTASPDPLDGPERRRRRVRLASRSKVAFHDREGDQDRDARGHKLWRGDALLHGWGSSQLTQDQPDQP